jgi:uncharacterized repeat protein (TIGR01451 family)
MPSIFRRLSPVFFFLLILSTLCLPGKNASAATLLVTSNADTGAGTLRNQIAAANPGDTIDFSFASSQIITLTSGELLINKTLTLQNTSGQSITISGNYASRVFHLQNNSTPITVTISGLNVTAGLTTSGGSQNGAGIWVNPGTGTLTAILSQVSVFNNVASGANNTGGGLQNDGGKVIIVNSTFSDNSAGGQGGGIWNNNAGPSSSMDLNFVTIVNNISNVDSASTGNGGGIFNSAGRVNLSNSILSNNSAFISSGPECSGTITSLGNNVVFNPAGCTFNPLGSDRTFTSPQIGPLQDNGGVTLSRALLPGSPAIDSADSGAACTGSAQGQANSNDQITNAIRPQGNGCDRGAYEFRPAGTASEADIQVSNTVVSTTPNVNDKVTYTIHVTNNGPNPAGNLRVTAIFDPNLTFVSSSLPPGVTCTGTGNNPLTIIQCSNGILPKNASADYIFTAKVNTAGVISVQASAIDLNNNDPDPTNNSDTAVLVTGSNSGPTTADLSITKTVDNSFAMIGDTPTFTVVVSNNSGTTAVGVDLNDQTNGNFNIVNPGDVTCTQSGGNGGTITFTPTTGSAVNSITNHCNVNLLKNGQTLTMTEKGSVTGIGEIDNIAVVSTSGTTDPNLSNNTAGASINGSMPQTDLSITKSVNPTLANVNATVTYTLNVKNTGRAATHAIVTDHVSGPVTIIASTVTANPGCSLDAPNKTITCDLGAMAVGTTTISYQGQVSGPGQIDNIASVSDTYNGNIPPTLDSNLSNNSAVASVVAQAASTPAMQVLPTSYNFVSVGVGTTSAPVPFTVSNTGTAALHVTGPVTGLLSNGFTVISNACIGANVQPGASCDILVTFTPASAGAVPATTFNVTSSDAGVNPVTVTLNGTGVTGPAMQVLPTTYDFGSIGVGVTSAPVPITVNNTGTSALHVTGPATGVLTNGFTVTSNPCIGVNLQPGASCNILATFSPPTTGALSATFNVTSSDAGVGSVLVTLNGTGVTGPAMQVLPTSFNFSSVGVGVTSAPVPITVNNTGTAPLHVTGPVTGLLPNGFTVTSNPCIGANLQPGASCDILVTFTPSSAGPAPATPFNVTSSDAGVGSVTVTLNGTGVTGPAMQVLPTSYDFGSIGVGMTSAPIPITVNNTGTAPLHVTDPVTGLLSNGFAVISNPCIGVNLQPGASCDILVTFTPSATGAVATTFDVVSSDAGVNSVTVTLNGNGVTGPAMQVLPTSYNFGSIGVGLTSAPIPVTVNNTGTAPLHVTGPVTGLLPNGFAVISNPCIGANLQPGASCDILVTFTPATAGAAPATTFDVTSSDVGVGPVTVTLTGNGVTGPAMQVLPTSFNFASIGVGVTSAPVPFTVNNTGTAPLHVTGPVTGLLPNGFTVISNPCIGVDLQPGASCDILVTFTPAATGAVATTFDVTSSDAGVNSVTVTLNGTGVQGAAIYTAPSSLNFQMVGVGVTSPSQKVLVTNVGTTPLTNVTASNNNAVFTPTVNCPLNVPIGGTCEVEVTFTPTAPGAVPQDTLTITGTDANGKSSQRTVTLDGNGVTGAALYISPTSLDFGDVGVGNTSPIQSVNVTNTGTVPVTSFSATLTTGTDYLNTTCTTPIPVGGTCKIDVRFKPTTVAPSIPDTLNISANGGAATGTVSLTGNGVSGAAIYIAPSSLSFASVGVGVTSPSQKVLVTNVGTTPLTNVTASNINAVFTSTVNCPLNVPIGGTCEVDVTFKPTAQGAVPQDTLTITGTDANGNSDQKTVALTGTGVVGAGIYIAPVSLDFGDIGQGNTSPAQIVNVTNVGTTPLTNVAGALTTGTDYSITNNCPLNVPVGGTCQFSVFFSPQSVANGITDILTITGTDVSGNTSTGNGPVSLTGNGIIGGAIYIAPTSLDFGSVGVGMTSVSQKILVTNVGTTSLTIVTASNNNAVFTPTVNCPLNVPVGGTCEVDVTFKPSGVGAVPQDTLTVTGTDGNGNTSQKTATLDGTGTNVIISTPTLSYNFTTPLNTTTTTSVPAQPITLTNNSASPITVRVSSMVISGTNPDQFQIVADACTHSDLAPGASCDMQVAYHPTNDNSATFAHSATLTFSGTDTLTHNLSNVVVVNLNGSTSANSQILVLPSSFDFGGQTVNTQSVGELFQVINQGTSDLSISALNLSDTTNYLMSETCTGASPIHAGGTCLVMVFFKPTATGAFPATIGFTTNASNPPTINLNGQGILGDVTVSSPLSFTSQVDVASASQTVTITNNDSTNSQDVILDHLVINGVQSNWFTVVNDGCSNLSLAKGNSCTFDVICTPQDDVTSATGNVLATFRPDNGTTQTTVNVGLNCNGTLPGISVAPNPDSFPAAVVGQSATHTYTVTKTGAAGNNLTIGNLQNGVVALQGLNPADFVINEDDCSQKTLTDAAPTCTFKVTFTPSAVGTRQTGILIPNNAASPDNHLILKLDGVGSDKITDLQLVKTVDKSVANVGEEVVFTITVSNLTANVSPNTVRVTDSLTGVGNFSIDTSDDPSNGVTITSGHSGSCTPDTNLNPLFINCDIDSPVVNGTPLVITVRGTVKGLGEIHNDAHVDITDGIHVDDKPANNSGSASVNGTSKADLQVSKSVLTSPPISVGDDVTYQITVTNNGPNDATNVNLNDMLLGGFDFNTPAPAGCSIVNPGLMTCALGDIANGDSVNFTYTAKAQSTGTFSNLATVSSDVSDPQTFNNTASAFATVVGSVSADLKVTKASNAPNNIVKVGSSVQYTITVTNNGPFDAQSVVIDDLVQSEFGTISGLNTTQGSCNPPNQGLITCALGALANGGTATITYTVDTSVNVGGANDLQTDIRTIDDFVTVSSVTNDPDTTNNVAQQHITVLPLSADLDIQSATVTSKVTGAAGQEVDTVTYTLQLTNLAGSDPALSSQLQFDLSDTPNQLNVANLAGTASLNGGAPSACTATFPTVICDLGDMKAGDGATIIISLNATVTDPLVDVAVLDALGKVTSKTFDPNLNNNITPAGSLAHQVRSSLEGGGGQHGCSLGKSNVSTSGPSLLMFILVPLTAMGWTRRKRSFRKVS